MGFFSNIWLSMSMALAAALISLAGYSYIAIGYKNHENVVLSDRNDKLRDKFALATSNNEVLRLSANMQNEHIAKLKIDVDLALKQYKIKEVVITKTIEKEKLIIRDINATQDCIEAKRIANEIINSL